MTHPNVETRSSLTQEMQALVESMVARTKRYARLVALWFLISGAALAALVAGLGTYHDKCLSSDTLAMGIMIFLFFGVSAAAAARQLLLQDLRCVPELEREGKAIAGRLASHRVGANGIHQLVVLWTEGDEQVGAHFDVDQLRYGDNGGSVTIVSSRRRQVGVVLDGQLYIAVRNTPRFLRWKAQQPK